MPQDKMKLDTYLGTLRWKLSKVSDAWTIEDYTDFIRFYSSIIPELMDAERCTVFIMELKDSKICSIYGTGLKDKQIAPPLEGSIVGKVMRSGKSQMINELDQHTGYHSYVDQQTGFTSYNMLCVPIKSLMGNDVIGAVQLLNKRDSQPFTARDLARLKEVVHFLSFSIESIILNQEIIRIAESLGKEMSRVQQDTIHGITMIAESPAMREVLDLVRMVSKSPVNVLVQGENGTGKELISRMIHKLGSRQENIFLPVNCAAIPENLVESLFFGHERGAFTGADRTQTGLFEEASSGTLFLDEIGDMPLMIQPKVLRAIQEEEGQRIGSNKIQKYNLRLISATNRDLKEEIRKGRFREDLFFRLFSVEIHIPPLRDRKDDILPLSLHFLRLTNERFGKNVVGFAPEVLDLLENFGWPGNVRQLQKEVERLVALTEDGEFIQPEQLSRDLLSLYATQTNDTGSKGASNLALTDQTSRLEIILINKAMLQCGGVKTKAAKLLNISRQGLDKKIKRHGLTF